MEIIDRKTALGSGLIRYFTGEPCIKGHVSERWVANGSCAVCAVERTRRWRLNGVSSTFKGGGKELPTQGYLKECFDYIFSTGELVWRQRPRNHFTSVKGMKVFNTKYVGKVAGHKHTRNNYLEVRLEGVLYRGHRIVYKLLTGDEPDGLVDHIDNNPSNNRIENLRVVDSQENARNAVKNKGGNNTSVYKGVSFQRGEWRSSVTVNDTPMVNIFQTEVEAAKDYDKRVKELFGEHCNLNFPEVSL